MAAFAELFVDLQGNGAPRMLGYADQGSPFVHVRNDPIAVEGLVSEQCIEPAPLDQRRDAEGVEATSRHQHEAHEAAQRIGQRQYLGRSAALGLAYRLTCKRCLNRAELSG